MKNLKITHKTILLSIEVPINLPYLTATADCQVQLYESKKGTIDVNCDDWNFNTFTFMGVEQECTHNTWNEFIIDQARYGLTIKEDIECEVQNYFNKETKLQILKISNYNK